MDECDDGHSASATRIGSVSEWRDGKSSEAVDVEAGAEERIVDERLCWKVYERRGFSDGLLRRYLAHVEGLYAA